MNWNGDTTPWRVFNGTGMEVVTGKEAWTGGPQTQQWIKAEDFERLYTDHLRLKEQKAIADECIKELEYEQGPIVAAEFDKVCSQRGNCNGCPMISVACNLETTCKVNTRLAEKGFYMKKY